MNKYNLTFHHLGLAVKKQDRSLQVLQGFGYKIGNTVLDGLQNVNLILCTHPAAPDIEIVFPANTSGPLESILKDNPVMFYHQCFETENLKESIRLINDDGNSLVTIAKPIPAVLFAGRFVSFYYLDGLGIIEILETDSN